MARQADNSGSPVSPHARVFLEHLYDMEVAGEAAARRVLGPHRDIDVQEAVNTMRVKWWAKCSADEADEVKDKPAWAYLVARNDALRIRKNNSRHVSLGDEFAEALENPVSSAQDRAKARETALILSDFLSGFVSSAMLRLSEEDADIFYRRVFEKQAYNDFAGEMDMAPATARKRFSRAMLDLADLFEKEVATDPVVSNIFKALQYTKKPMHHVLRDLLEFYADGSLRDLLDDAEEYDDDDEGDYAAV